MAGFLLRRVDVPLGPLVLGLILGWIMLAVLGPIYDTISKIRA